MGLLSGWVRVAGYLAPQILSAPQRACSADEASGYVLLKGKSAL